MNPLMNILKDLGNEAAIHFSKYGGKIGSGELRENTINALTDRLSSGISHPSGISSREILNHTPMLYRAEDIGRTAGRINPEYNNIAVSTLDTAPLGFGGGNNNSHLTVLYPELMANKGTKAISLEDTGWVPFKGMGGEEAQKKQFIDEFGAKSISNREDLRNIAWDIDNLDKMRSTGWLELNAPITNKDVAIKGYKDHTFIDGEKGKLSSRPETLDEILKFLKTDNNRDNIKNRLNKILPIVTAIPASGSVLSGLMGGGADQEYL